MCTVVFTWTNIVAKKETFKAIFVHEQPICGETHCGTTEMWN